MSINETFYSVLSECLEDGRLPKGLRLNAHEYADYAHGLEPDQDGDHAITNQRYGRSSGSNN